MPIDNWAITHDKIAAMDNQSIISEVEAFLAKTRMKETTFGKKAVNDGKAVRRLRSGKRMWPETIDKLREFMASNDTEQAA